METLAVTYMEAVLFFYYLKKSKLETTPSVVVVFCTGNTQDLPDNAFSILSWSREQEHK
jgi:hypothetical protein